MEWLSVLWNVPVLLCGVLLAVAFVATAILSAHVFFTRKRRDRNWLSMLTSLLIVCVILECLLAAILLRFVHISSFAVQVIHAVVDIVSAVALAFSAYRWGVVRGEKGSTPHADGTPVRWLETHIPVGAFESNTEVGAYGDTGAGGGENVYQVFDNADKVLATIRFQKGPVPTAGVTGVTLEDLIAISADRLAGFQAGPYPCAENAAALGCLQLALAHLHSRTTDRQNRLVKGKLAA